LLPRRKTGHKNASWEASGSLIAAGITILRLAENHSPVSVSILEAVVLSNCVHRAEPGPSSYSGGLEHLALGRDAIQQILPGLGERSDPFFEELGRHGVCVNTGLGEFCQFLAWD